MQGTTNKAPTTRHRNARHHKALHALVLQVFVVASNAERSRQFVHWCALRDRLVETLGRKKQNKQRMAKH